MQEEKNKEKKEEHKPSVSNKSKEIKKYQTRAERKAALIFQLYNLMNSN